MTKKDLYPVYSQYCSKCCHDEKGAGQEPCLHCEMQKTIDGIWTFPTKFFLSKSANLNPVVSDDNYDWVPYKDVEKNIEKEAGFDAVSHPSHYTEGRQYEPRKVIHDWGLNFNLGNAVKYISRAGRKGDALEDLKKARQYLDFEIEEMEKEDK